MNFDALIIGGGVAGMQCALVLGSANNKAFVKDKKIGIIMHQKTSHLKSALFNNVLGVTSGKLGSDLLIEGKKQLTAQYPNVIQIENDKVLIIDDFKEGYKITTIKNTYYSKVLIIAMNYAKPFNIKGLESYIIPHEKTDPIKDRIQLANTNHLIKQGLYCCGTIAGFRSQFAIAAGSGASVATDVLTLWNDGKHTKVHDKI